MSDLLFHILVEDAAPGKAIGIKEAVAMDLGWGPRESEKRGPRKAALWLCGERRSKGANAVFAARRKRS